MSNVITTRTESFRRVDRGEENCHQKVQPDARKAAWLCNKDENSARTSKAECPHVITARVPVRTKTPLLCASTSSNQPRFSAVCASSIQEVSARCYAPQRVALDFRHPAWLSSWRGDDVANRTPRGCHLVVKLRRTRCSFVPVPPLRLFPSLVSTV